jgi:hypothetical protein
MLFLLFISFAFPPSITLPAGAPFRAEPATYLKSLMVFKVGSVTARRGTAVADGTPRSFRYPAEPAKRQRLFVRSPSP